MGFQGFISKSFGLTVPKIFVREPLSAVFHKIYGWEKDFDKRGDSHDFHWKTFCPTVPKNSLGVILWCFKEFEYRKSLD